MSAPRARFFVTLWGVVDVAGGRHKLSELPTLFKKFKALGYDGVECPIGLAMQVGIPAFKAALTDAGLSYIAMAFSDGPNIPGALGLKSDVGIVHPPPTKETRDVDHHFRVWAAQVEEAMAMGDVLVEVTSHTGRDYFTDAETDRLLGQIAEFEKKTGARVNHETHRGRILYSPWTTPAILARHPSLYVCADYSHFCCVAEADTVDPELNAAVKAIEHRVRHVHARTGFPEGPQVPDVRGKTWAPHFEGHQRWWSGIFADYATRGEAAITITPEHGPAPYQWTLPMDDKPVADVWDVNHHVGLVVNSGYAKQFGAAAAAALVPDPDYA